MLLKAILIIVAIVGALAIKRAYSSADFTPLKVEYAQSVSTQERFDTLDSWLDKLYRSKQFNGAVLIGDGKEVLFSKSYGLEDAETSRLLSERSAFNLASVSKQFTGMAVLLLDHEGKLSVTDPIQKHIPELAMYPDITVEHLLHHTSGIADYIALAAEHEADEELFTTSDLITLFSTHEPPLAFNPGESFDYSNTGYVLLAEIVARASQQTFEAYMHDNVFTPAGMEDSQVFNLLSEEAPANRVFGFQRHFLLSSRLTPNDLNNFDGVVGDGGVYATAEDLHRWHLALLNDTLLPQSVFQRAITSGVLSDGSKTGYGYGWALGDGVSDHSGGWAGFSTYLFRNLDTDMLLVVLDNSTNGDRAPPSENESGSISLNLVEFVYGLPTTAQ